MCDIITSTVIMMGLVLLIVIICAECDKKEANEVYKKCTVMRKIWGPTKPCLSCEIARKGKVRDPNICPLWKIALEKAAKRIVNEKWPDVPNTAISVAKINQEKPNQKSLSKLNP